MWRVGAERLDTSLTLLLKLDVAEHLRDCVCVCFFVAVERVLQLGLGPSLVLEGKESWNKTGENTASAGLSICDGRDIP